MKWVPSKMAYSLSGLLPVAMFLVLFVTTGIGNGSTYRMIPSIFREENLRKADRELYDFQKENELLAVSLEDRQNLVSSSISAFSTRAPATRWPLRLATSMCNPMGRCT